MRSGDDARVLLLDYMPPSIVALCDPVDVVRLGIVKGIELTISGVTVFNLQSTGIGIDVYTASGRMRPGSKFFRG